MNDLDGFVIEGTRGVYRPTGTVSLEQAIALVRAGIAEACAKNVGALLIDTTALTGFASPDTFQRFLAAVDWAGEARGRVRLAMVARPEMIDREKFGVTVAGNRGLVSNVFSAEHEARVWLDAGRGARARPE